MRFKLKSLECNIVHHCINNCVGCSHLSPINKPFFADLDIFKKDLENISKVAESPRFSLLGGEPLLHPKLLELIDIAKKSDITDTICVTTNGQLLDKMIDEFWEKIDQIIISWYPGKFDGSKIESYRDKFMKYRNPSKEKDFIVQRISKFYMPISAVVLSYEESEKMFVSCHWRDHCTTIDNGYFYLCPQACFFPKVFFNEPMPVDGLLLDGITYEKLESFFYSKEKPFLSCKRCSYGRWVQWKETTKDNWMRISMI